MSVIPKGVIGFTGFAQSGKDTAAKFLMELGYERLSFADALRDALYVLNPKVSEGYDGWNDGDSYFCHRVKDIVDSKGWERAKVEHPEIRQLLQRLGTEVGRAQFGENFWVDRVTSQFKPGGRYVITDVRFPNEEKAVHDHGGIVCRIVRPGFGAVNSHVSDTGIDSLFVDIVIPNTGESAV